MGWLLAQMEPDTDGGMHAVVDSLARTPLSIVLLAAIALTVVRLILHPLLVRPRRWWTPPLRLVSELLDAITYAGVLVFFLVRPFLLQAYNIPTGSMVPTLLVDDYILANKAVYRLSDPKVGDIVVFRPPKAATRAFERDEDGEVNVDFIKRCVGAPGDLVEMRQDVLYRNGKPVREPYARFMTEYPPGQDLTYREMRRDEYQTQLKEDFKLVRYRGGYWPALSADDSINDSDSTATDFRVPDDDAMRQIRSLPPARIPPGYYLMFGDNRLHSYDSRSWGLVPRSSIVGRAEAIWLPFRRARRLGRDAGIEAK